MNLNRFIDHTLLHPQAFIKEIEKLCQEAREYQFYSVMVNPVYISHAVSLLKDCDIKVGSVVGFPLGANREEIKIAEAVAAVNDGADEIDVVANIGALDAGEFEKSRIELYQIKKALPSEIVMKVIIETPILKPDHWPDAVQAVIESGADFVKSATGFFGSTPVEHITALAKFAEGKIKVKAAGGIKTAESVLAMIEAGAERIGCSASLAIMRDFESRFKK